MRGAHPSKSVLYDGRCLTTIPILPDLSADLDRSELSVASQKLPWSSLDVNYRHYNAFREALDRFSDLPPEDSLVSSIDLEVTSAKVKFDTSDKEAIAHRRVDKATLPCQQSDRRTQSREYKSALDREELGPDDEALDRITDAFVEESSSELTQVSLHEVTLLNLPWCLKT